MPAQPSITRTWINVGGSSGGFGAHCLTWGQVRTAVAAQFNPSFVFGFSLTNYDYGVPGTSASVADTSGKLFRGIPGGVSGNLAYEGIIDEPLNLKVYFFWGGYYSNPFDPGQPEVQTIGAGLDVDEIALILGGASVTLNGGGVTASSPSWDNSHPLGQLVGTFPGTSVPDEITAITTIA
jgi:hypothetical protein